MPNVAVSSGMISVINDLCSRRSVNKVATELGMSSRTIRKYNDSRIYKSRTGLIRLNKPKFRIFDPDTAAKEIKYESALVQAKFDGMRIEVTKNGDEVEFFSEDELKEKTEKLSIQAEELSRFSVDRFVLDAEALWFHSKGKPGFRTDITGYLNSKESDKDDNVILFVFDLVRWGDMDLTKMPLKMRLEFLDKLNSSPHVKIMNKDKRMGFIVKPNEFESAMNKVSKLPASEGAMVKDINSPYLKDSIQNSGWTKWKKLSEVDVIVLKREPVKDSPGVYNFHTGVGPISDRDARNIGPKKTWLFRDKYYMYLGKTFNAKLPANVGDIIRVEGQILRDTINDNIVYSIFTPRVVEEVPEKDKTDSLAVLENLFKAQRLPPKRPKEEVTKEEADEFIETIKPGNPITKSKDISKEEFEKYSKERGPLPDRFYESPLHTNGWVQFHIRGITQDEKDKFEKGDLSLESLIRMNSVHADIRIKGPKGKLIQWVLPGDPKENLAKLKRAIEGRTDPDTGQTQKIRGIVKPSAEAARDEPAKEPAKKLFKMILDTNLKQAECIPCHLFMKEDKWGVSKGSFWIPPGEVGANPDTWSYMLLVDRIDIDGGVQRRDMHEYWIQGKHFNGRYVFRAQKQADDVFWQVIKSEDEFPLNPKEHKDAGELFPIFETKVRRAEIKKSDDLKVALDKIDKKQFAKVNQMESKGDKILQLDQVFQSLPKDPVVLKENFIMLTGGIANRGSTDGDIDVLIRCSKDNDEFNIPAMFRALRGIDDDEMRKEFAKRVEWCYKDSIQRPDGKIESMSDYGGPFTSYVPLYDLFLIPRQKSKLIKMMEKGSGKTMFQMNGTCGPILKSADVTADKGDIYVAGYASTPKVDRQGDEVDMSALGRAFNVYFGDKRFANLNAMHLNFPVGELIEKLDSPQGILRNGFDKKGLHVVGKLRDPLTPMLRQVRQEVLDRKLSSFSIGGWFHDKRMVCDTTGHCAKKIFDMELWEITLCYTGANKEATFQVFTF